MYVKLLSADVWINIISHLCSRDVSELSRTCRALHGLDLLNEWLSLGECIHFDGSPQYLIRFLVQYGNAVKTMHLRRDATSEMHRLAACPALSTLALSRFDSALFSALSSCHNLTSLTLCRASPNLTNADLTTLASIPLLSHVKIKCCGSFRRDDTFPRALYIPFEHCSGLEDITSVFSCTTLCELELDLCRIPATHLPPPAFGATLHTLDLKGFSNLNSIDSLACCTVLDTLDIDYTKVRHIRALSHCTRLRYLSMHNCRTLTSIQPLAHCVMLQELNISGTSVEDISALSSCPLLEILYMTSTYIADISPLASYGKLQELRMHYTDDLGPLRACTDIREIQLIARGEDHLVPLGFCTALEILNLTIVTTQDLSALTFCTNLYKLKLRLEFCRRAAVDISPLGACKQLQVLHISHLPSLQNIGPLRTLSGLLKLKIVGCPELVDIEPLTGCQSLVSLIIYKTGVTNLLPLCYCKSLASIRIIHPPGRTHKGVSELKKKGISVLQYAE